MTDYPIMVQPATPGQQKEWTINETIATRGQIGVTVAFPWGEYVTIQPNGETYHQFVLTTATAAMVREILSGAMPVYGLPPELSYPVFLDEEQAEALAALVKGEAKVKRPGDYWMVPRDDLPAPGGMAGLAVVVTGAILAVAVWLLA